MLSESKLEIIKKISNDFSRDEIIWTKGYLAGLIDGQKITSVSDTVIPSKVLKTSILYGTETGNAKKTALQLASEFKKAKLTVKTSDLQTYKIEDLSKEELVIFVLSTQGDGEFPAGAVKFYNSLVSTTTDFSGLKFAVFGLGDSSYPLFCNAALLLNETLKSKKAVEILPVFKGDVDYEIHINNWYNQVLKVIENEKSNVAPIFLKTISEASTHEKKTYTGTIQKNIVLNDRGSLKRTHHLEISTAEQVLYSPGDALGIFPKNNKDEILKIINLISASSQDQIKIKNEIKSIEEWLEILNIRGLSGKTLESVSHLIGVKLNTSKSDLYPLLLQSSGTIDAEKLLTLLGKIAPRLYSIASSPAAHEGEVHLTVGLNTFTVDGNKHYGLGSGYLCEMKEGTEIEYYIHKNSSFRLPAEDKDIIMIGPGTGIAPFRSFIAERDAAGHSGNNWLFFGEQTFAYDFYYQTEIQEWLSTGTLTKFNGAFSRDQKNKVYVQHRMKENAEELLEWIESGASIYVCGQKEPMSKDVENTLLEIISQGKGISLEKANEYLDDMISDNRYLKDVY
jgi:sulfite reductase (NADPH) flavoprotein alpha-component